MTELHVGGRFVAAGRALRRDLWAAETDGPRTDLPRWLSVFVNLGLVVTGAALLVSGWNRYFVTYQLGVPGILIALCQAVVPALALHRPIPAWWMSTLMQLALSAAWFMPGEVAFTPGEIVLTPGGADFHHEGPRWTGVELALQAWALFFVALRNRPRIAAETLVISVVAGLLAVFVWGFAGHAVFKVAVLSIAALVGSALHSRNVARSRLVVQEERTAEERARRTVLEERTRIARELHDVVAHHMSVISIQAQAAPHLVEQPSAELKETLESIRRSAKDALTELRQVLGVLRSEGTGSEGERHAPQPDLDRLNELVATVRGAGLDVTLSTSGERVPLAQGVELSAFRIVQEALSNAMRHAPGAGVDVDIRYHRRQVTVRVTNTAPTRPAPCSPGAGHGLLGMRERAAMLGGTVAFGTTADGGYEVTAVLPGDVPAAPEESTESTA
ncbi:sensor histidine kinase [Streptomyces sp. NPDC002490]|uniref:sensor histidine kinase n=1 Tax=Streptomyces sp. NPDC002490 TaxID=3154416 RepID=UPI003322B94B